MGIPLGGVRLPDMEAPLGVYGGQNARLKNPLCMLAVPWGLIPHSIATSALCAHYLVKDQ
jgi:hypothetical protein